LAWVPVRLVCDDPAKVLGESGQQDLLTAQFGPVLLSAQREIDIVSPYFVPGKRGTADLVGLARRGVGVRVLTNSLAATDVGAVHAGYVKRRQTLLGGSLPTTRQIR
jgi:putative cardiolipin synthase